ncbi:MAG: cation:proton antiporter [Acidilobaceae archaeon]
MSVEFELMVLGASLGLAALAGYATERLRLGPFIGAILVGMAMRLLSSFIGVDLESEAWLLLLLAAMLIVFESGREVGEAGFDGRLIYAVLIEVASIFGLTLLVTAPLKLEFWERVALAIVLLSSSTTTIYLFVKNLRLAEAKSIVLSWTVLEDIALILALSMALGYPEANPLVLLIASTVLALFASITINTLFSIVPPRGPYGIALLVSLVISYGMIAGYFASPYLGVFIVGYIFAKRARGESLEQFSDLAVIVYGVSVGLITPLESLLASPETLLFIAIATVLALVVRAAAVFLASLMLLRSTFYSTILALSMQNISELAPLVALTLEEAGLIKPELASVMVLLPVLTIAFSNITANYWTTVASIVNKYLAVNIGLWIPQGFYEAGVKLLVTASKITMVFIGIFITHLAIDRFEVSHLAIIPAIVLGGILVARFLKELSWELRYVHGLPAVIAEALTAIAAGSLAIYVTVEILSKYVEVEFSTFLALLAVLLVVGMIVEVALATRRVLTARKSVKPIVTDTHR